MPRIGKSQGIERAFNDVFPIPINAGRAPTSADLKFPIGQIWLDTVNGLSYILAKVASGSATWNSLAPSSGQATLVSGTVTIANTSLTATDKIFLTRADENSSTALGMLTITALTASTSFVVTALDPSDGSTTITGDVSVINYFIVR